MAETFSSTRREVPAADIAVAEENLRVLRHTSQSNAWRICAKCYL